MRLGAAILQPLGTSHENSLLAQDSGTEKKKERVQTAAGSAHLKMFFNVFKPEQLLLLLVAELISGTQSSDEMKCNVLLQIVKGMGFFAKRYAKDMWREQGPLIYISAV